MGKNKFELSLNNILPLQIPTIFIENFDNLVSFYENSNLPSNPKAIFTSNAAWPETHIAYYIGKLKKIKQDFSTVNMVVIILFQKYYGLRYMKKDK